MTQSTPILHVFAISHYCEKARWALDYLGVPYTLNYAAPGQHAKLAKKLGAAKTSVPYLEFEDAVIQGSADILTWAESQGDAKSRRLTCDAEQQIANDIERRVDEIAGVHIRRYYYSEALVEHPETVRPLFTSSLGFPKNLLIRFAFPKIRSIMIKVMDLGEAQGEQSRDIVARELDWLDELLADGRTFLVAGQFSRVDVAVASLLSPLALPPEHPVYKGLSHPPRLASQIQSWSDRRSLTWTKEMYATFR